MLRHNLGNKVKFPKVQGIAKLKLDIDSESEEEPVIISEKNLRNFQQIGKPSEKNSDKLRHIKNNKLNNECNQV